MAFQPGANLYTQGFGSRAENIEVPHIDSRAPSSTDIFYPVGKWWLFAGNSLWYLLNQSSVGGSLSSNWIQIAGSGGSGVNSVTGSNGVVAFPTSGSVVVSGINATTSSVGVASFNSSDFTVSGAGEVSLIATPSSYTNVVGPTTYTVLSTDYFLSADCTAGAVTIVLPATTTLNRQFIVKDRLGFAATNNITITSSAGTTIDTASSQILSDNFESLEILFHSGTPNNYEVF